MTRKLFLFFTLGMLALAAPMAGAEGAVRTSTATDGVSLTVGLAVDDGNPSQCGSSTTLIANVGDWVNYCYTVTNNSQDTLRYQSLADDSPTVVFSDVAITLSPGESYQYNRLLPASTSKTITSTWIASDELPGYTANSFALPFIDIASIGQIQEVSDDGYAAVEVPFPVAFYGETSTLLALNNNGYLLFGVSGGAAGYYQNLALPTTDFAAAIIPFWDDLDIGGNIYSATLGAAPNRQFVVEYSAKNHVNIQGGSDAGGITFEVVINESDETIDFIYDSVEFHAQAGANDSGRSATVGVQSGTGLYNQYSYDSASLTDGQSIEWVPVSPTSYSASAMVSIEVDAPRLSIPQSSLSASVARGESVSAPLAIGNVGNQNLEWSSVEAPSRAHFPKTPATPVALHSPARASRLPAPESKEIPWKLHEPFTDTVFAVPAFGVAYDISGGYFENFDASAPGPAYLVGFVQTFDQYLLAGTFAENDFSVEYVVNYPYGTLIAMSTQNGTAQSIGDTGLGNMVTGIRWDPTTGTTYLTSYDDVENSSQLYTIDLSTAAIEAIGAAMPGVLMTDIAIAPNGLMYGVDNVSDMLVAIDKYTGDEQAIGSLGFNANYAEGLDFDPASGVLYFTGYDADNNVPGMYTIDTSTGAASLIPGLMYEMDAFAIAAGSPCTMPGAVSWLSVEPGSGTVSPGTTATVDVVFDASGLPVGSYSANVCVYSNDITQRYAAVSVSLVVTDPAFDRIHGDGFDGP